MDSKLIEMEKDIRDVMINGLVAMQKKVRDLGIEVDRLAKFTSENITIEKLQEACMEGPPTLKLRRAGRGPSHIILHHSLTKDSGTVSWGAIRKYHTQDKGWRDIGYHFGIEDVGGHYEMFAGRMPDEAGAHCTQQGMNRKSVGICCVGNFDVIEPPYEQLMSCLKLVRYLSAAWGIKTDNVLGHREVALDGRSCPGRLFDMGEFRSLI